MAKVIIGLRRAQIRAQLLKGAGTKDYLQQVAQRVADQSGLSCEVGIYTGTNRANASVSIASVEDYYRNLHTNALIAALY